MRITPESTASGGCSAFRLPGYCAGTGKCKAPGIGRGVAGTIGIVVWFVLAGWWLAITHISAVVALAITIIGIPFA